MHNKSESDDKLQLRNLILLDKQFTMDLICNKKFTSKIKKSREKLRVKSNSGALVVNQRSEMPVHKIKTWFINKAITNIVSLKNVIKQYRVTYDSNNKKFVVYIQDPGLPNTVFLMHSLGLHVYDPKGYGEENMVFMNNVSDNMKVLTKKDTKGSKRAKRMYAKLLYPSDKDFRWVVQNNHIKNFDTTIQNIGVAQEIWGKDIDALKGKTTRSKPNVIAEVRIKTQRELQKILKQCF